MAAVTRSPFVSHAQNGEDVVLWRALQGVESGRYVDVGANHPVHDSVTKAFYDRGWSGLSVEPVAAFAAALREARPRDVVAEVAVTDTDGGEVVLHAFADTGLSTLRDEYVRDAVGAGHALTEVRVPTRRLDSLVAEHLADAEVHFCKVDVEGAEAQVLASVDLTAWRPWVLVVEATRPNSTEGTHAEWEPGVLAAGYRSCLFDGLSRFYVAEEHADLAPALSYPACVLDGAVTAELLAARSELAHLQHVHHETVQELERLRGQLGRVGELEREVATLRSELVRWRGQVLERWAAATGGDSPGAGGAGGEEATRLHAEIAAMRRTLSWRVTRPLRSVRALQKRTGV